MKTIQKAYICIICKKTTRLRGCNSIFFEFKKTTLKPYLKNLPERFFTKEKAMSALTLENINMSIPHSENLM